MHTLSKAPRSMRHCIREAAKKSKFFNVGAIETGGGGGGGKGPAIKEKKLSFKFLLMTARVPTVIKLEGEELRP